MTKTRMQLIEEFWLTMDDVIKMWNEHLKIVGSDVEPEINIARKIWDLISPSNEPTMIEPREETERKVKTMAELRQELYKAITKKQLERKLQEAAKRGREMLSDPNHPLRQAAERVRKEREADPDGYERRKRELWNKLSGLLDDIVKWRENNEL